MLHRFIPANQLSSVVTGDIEVGIEADFTIKEQDFAMVQFATQLNTQYPSQFDWVKRMPSDMVRSYYNQRKLQLAAKFNFDWVKCMPRDMVREFHKHLDYDSRIAELLHKHPYIIGVGESLTTFFTSTQIQKIFHEGFVVKMSNLTTNNRRTMKPEIVSLFPERPVVIYKDAGFHDQVWTGIRHPLIPHFEKMTRQSPESMTIRDILRNLTRVVTEFPAFDRFLRRTAYYMISSIIIFKDTVIASRMKRYADHKALCAARAAVRAKRRAAKDAVRAAALATAKAKKEAEKAAAMAVIKVEKEAVRFAAMVVAKAEKAVVLAVARAEKAAAMAVVKAEKMVVRTAAREVVKAEKAAAMAVVKAEKMVMRTAAREVVKAEKAAVARGVKVVTKANKEVGNKTAGKCETIQRVFRSFLERRSSQVSVE